MPRYAIRLMFEWGGGCLWCGNDAAREAFDVGPIDDRLPLSPETRRRLDEISAWHDTSLDRDDPAGPGPGHPMSTHASTRRPPRSWKASARSWDRISRSITRACSGGNRRSAAGPRSGRAGASDAAHGRAAESAKADFAIFQRRIHSLQRADGTVRLSTGIIVLAARLHHIQRTDGPSPRLRGRAWWLARFLPVSTDRTRSALPQP
jgi:hypothetical protein